MKNKQWWQQAVIYQIYPKSFYDSNNDGIGDLQGIIQKLDYLQNLGIDVIWLCPIYQSPMQDNGYDVANYYEINEMFGTMADFDLLIVESKKRKIKIMMDIVLNHTSDQHQWFLESKKNKTNCYHDYYIWRDQRNDLKSIFGGSAWTFNEDLQQYYFHMFADQQPDLNWDNEKVRLEIAKIINFWVTKGVVGFRFDVIDLIGKNIDKKILANGPNLHQYIKELRANSWKTDEIVTVGECWGASLETGIQYSKPQAKELSMIFQFEHIAFNYDKELNKWKKDPFDLVTFKKIITKWQQGLQNQGWNSLFFENHDLPRSVSVFGDPHYFWSASAKLLAGVNLSLQGTPYIYQGQEIGMTNVKNWALSDYQDLEIHNAYKELVEEKKLLTASEFMKSVEEVGRDNARTGFQWSNELNAGFTTAKPWIKGNDNYLEINVENQINTPNSILSFYQKMIKLRKDTQYSTLFSDGDFEIIDLYHPQLMIYTRKQIIKNYYSLVIDLQMSRIIIQIF
ncbi:alpha-glucosidase [Spiroplasma sp. SV19]|uniref:alpha-glucosidase n=1 Tax=Spiroplasma sp. SV19 TaxID=2570468 RepID=UPI0024B6BBAC|nr:alpha-glucosidase [Spiroplasma sp. SV19]WHQ37354.1 glucohydrolase [Spiroplasma sp. SV19]